MYIHGVDALAARPFEKPLAVVQVPCQEGHTRLVASEPENNITHIRRHLPAVLVL
jgi:hypothetical protein